MEAAIRLKGIAPFKLIAMNSRAALQGDRAGQDFGDAY